MRRAALVLLGAFPVVPALPAGRAEHGLALLHELEADVHELSAQLERKTDSLVHTFFSPKRRPAQMFRGPPPCPEFLPSPQPGAVLRPTSHGHCHWVWRDEVVGDAVRDWAKS